ncbi:hypothetical protein FB570_11621 [Streptomyces sp. T12]|nr:hypothetical protein FB570_11621 [Streptomyces sp. T12]
MSRSLAETQQRGPKPRPLAFADGSADTAHDCSDELCGHFHAVSTGGGLAVGHGGQKRSVSGMCTGAEDPYGRRLRCSCGRRRESASTPCRTVPGRRQDAVPQDRPSDRRDPARPLHRHRQAGAVEGRPLGLLVTPDRRRAPSRPPGHREGSRDHQGPVPLLTVPSSGPLLAPVDTAHGWPVRLSSGAPAGRAGFPGTRPSVGGPAGTRRPAARPLALRRPGPPAAIRTRTGSVPLRQEAHGTGRPLTLGPCRLAVPSSASCQAARMARDPRSFRRPMTTVRFPRGLRGVGVTWLDGDAVRVMPLGAVRGQGLLNSPWQQVQTLIARHDTDACITGVH